MRSKDGDWPLTLASRHGHTECVAALLENRAKVDVRGNDGKTPLIIAALEGHADCVRLLYGSDINAQDRKKYSCINASGESKTCEMY